jgi:hypothetical protein
VEKPIRENGREIFIVAGGNIIFPFRHEGFLAFADSFVAGFGTLVTMVESK